MCCPFPLPGSLLTVLPFKTSVTPLREVGEIDTGFITSSAAANVCKSHDGLFAKIVSFNTRARMYADTPL